MPYVQGLDALCRSRDCSFGFEDTVNSFISGAIGGTMSRETFGIVNMASLVMIQLIPVIPDMREHIPCLGA